MPKSCLTDNRSLPKKEPNYYLGVESVEINWKINRKSTGKRLIPKYGWKKFSKRKRPGSAGGQWLNMSWVCPGGQEGKWHPGLYQDHNSASAGHWWGTSNRGGTFGAIMTIKTLRGWSISTKENGAGDGSGWGVWRGATEGAGGAQIGEKELKGNVLASAQLPDGRLQPGGGLGCNARE